MRERVMTFLSAEQHLGNAYDEARDALHIVVRKNKAHMNTKTADDPFLAFSEEERQKLVHLLREITHACDNMLVMCGKTPGYVDRAALGKEANRV